MFEGALNRGPAAKPRLVTGTVLSIVLHAALLAGALWLPGSPPEDPPETPPKEFPTVRLDKVRNGSSKAKPTAQQKRAAKQRPVARKPDTIAIASKHPPQRPPEVEPPPELTPEPDDDASDELPGHEQGRCEGDDCDDPPPCPEGDCSYVDGPGDDGIYVFDSRMTRPVKRSGEAPQYSREAREAGIQGVMVVKCVVQISGELDRCRTIKPLPFMERPVLDALATWRYTPATLDGRPIAVDYIFTIHLRMPR